jgi:hypothetical protein
MRIRPVLDGTTRAYGAVKETAMMTGFVRDAAATAAINSFFGSTWFGWAQEHPPKS